MWFWITSQWRMLMVYKWDFQITTRGKSCLEPTSVRFATPRKRESGIGSSLRSRTAAARLSCACSDGGVLPVAARQPSSAPRATATTPDDLQLFTRLLRTKGQIFIEFSKNAQVVTRDQRAAAVRRKTASSNDGSGLINGLSFLADSSVVSMSLGSNLVIAASSGSGSHTSSPISRPRSSYGQNIWIVFVRTSSSAGCELETAGSRFETNPHSRHDRKLAAQPLCSPF